MVTGEWILYKWSVHKICFITMGLLLAKHIVRIVEDKDAYIIYRGSLLENWAVYVTKKVR
jgi:hypothetical protein